MRDPRVNCLDKCARKRESLTSPKLQGTGPTPAKIMIVGEAPGQDEDKRGVPFIGPSGKLLSTVLAELGIPREDVYITNSVKCATAEENQKPSKREIGLCRAYLIDEIARVNPNVICTLGATALESVTKRTGISKLKNTILFSKEFTCKVVPTWHPAYVLRNPSAYDELKAGLVLAIEESASKKIVERNKIPTRHLDAKKPEQIDKVLSALESSDSFVFDLETTSLDIRISKIITIALSWKVGTGVTIKWSRLSDEQMLRLRALLVSPKHVKGGHHVSYDIEVLMKNGIPVAPPVFDCLNAISLLNENLKDKGLDTLVLQYLDLGEYWAPLDEYKKQYIKDNRVEKGTFSYDLIPYPMLAEYAQCDADATFRLMKIFKKQLKEVGLMDFYDKYTLPTMWNIIQMEYRGIKVDREKLRGLVDEYGKKVKEAEKTIKKNPTVAKYNKIKFAREKNALIEKWSSSKTLSSRFPEVDSYIKTRGSAFSGGFNPGSVSQLREILYDVLKLRPVKITDSKQNSTDEETLNIYANEYDVQLAKDILVFRRMSKFKSTYVDSIYAKSAVNGRIHPSYMQHRTVTGRLCVSGDTILETTAGPIRIADLALEDMPDVKIETHWGRYRQIINRYFKGDDLMFRVTTESGNSIVCTPGHQLLTPCGWRCLGDLNKGYEVYVRMPNNIVRENDEFQPFTTSRIVSIKPVGIQGVWDIEVEEDHSYIAHGFANHNSSNNPNFQNIPRDAKDFKSCFLADKGMVFVKGDLAQAEFRCWAHYSNDTAMIKDIEAGLDIHRRTASEVFGVSEEEITKEQRTVAKATVFGLMYGRGTNAIAKQFGMDKEQAAEIKEVFFNRYPIAASWLDDIVRYAKQNKQVVTWMGRVRRLPEIDSMEEQARAEAERQAKNSPIQGLASDMNNHFMARTLRVTKKNNIKCYPAATIHDANVLQVAPVNVTKLVKIMKHVLKTAFPEFRCEMKLDFEVGETLGTMEELDTWLEKNKKK